MGKQQQTLFQTDAPAWEIDDAAEAYVASVVFSEAPYGPYDYAVPDRLRTAVSPGRRVRVPLGRGDRTMIGYCVRLEHRLAGDRALKEIREIVDDRPLLTPGMLRLTEWMSDYYLSPWGVVLDAVVPAGVRGQAGTRAVTFLRVPTHVAAKLSQLDLPPKQLDALKILAASPQPLTPQQLARAARCTLAPIARLRAGPGPGRVAASSQG